MAFPVSENSALEFTIRGHYDEQEIDNVFWFVAKPLPGGTTFPVADGSQRALLALIQIWEDSFCPLIPLGYFVDQYIIRKAIVPFPGGSPKWNFSDVDVIAGVSPVDAGGGSATSLPTFATVNAWYKATPAGRSGRGRKSFSPVQEADTKTDEGGGNALTDTALAAWQAAVDLIKVDIFTGLADPDFVISPRVGSLKSYLAAAALSNIFRVLTGVTVRRMLGSQTSRKRKNRFA